MQEPQSTSRPTRVQQMLTKAIIAEFPSVNLLDEEWTGRKSPASTSCTYYNRQGVPLRCQTGPQSQQMQRQTPHNCPSHSNNSPESSQYTHQSENRALCKGDERLPVRMHRCLQGRDARRQKLRTEIRLPCGCQINNLIKSTPRPFSIYI